MEPNSNVKTIKLVSSDKVDFFAPVCIARECKLVRDMVESDESDDFCASMHCRITEVPVQEVDSRTLKKVLEYCEKHGEEAEKIEMAEAAGNSSAVEESKEHLKEWDKEFVMMDLDLLYDVLLASNYLVVDKMTHLLAQAVADMIKGKSPEQIRSMFKIKNDFTPEEEEEIRKQHAWAFERHQNEK